MFCCCCFLFCCFCLFVCCCCLLLCLVKFQCHLKNLIQALISSQTSWKLRPATTFHHSFGHGPSSHSLRFPLPPWSSHSHQFPDMAERVGLRGVSEAEAIRIASLSGPVKELEPLNLFHLRDALKVCDIRTLHN